MDNLDINSENLKPVKGLCTCITKDNNIKRINIMNHLFTEEELTTIHYGFKCSWCKTIIEGPRFNSRLDPNDNYCYTCILWKHPSVEDMTIIYL